MSGSWRLLIFCLIPACWHPLKTTPNNTWRIGHFGSCWTSTWIDQGLGSLCLLGSMGSMVYIYLHENHRNHGVFKITLKGRRSYWKTGPRVYFWHAQRSTTWQLVFLEVCSKHNLEEKFISDSQLLGEMLKKTMASRPCKRSKCLSFWPHPSTTELACELAGRPKRKRVGSSHSSKLGNGALGVRVWSVGSLGYVWLTCCFGGRYILDIFWIQSKELTYLIP